MHLLVCFIPDVIEYIANLTVDASNLKEGVNITSAADTVVNSVSLFLAASVIYFILFYFIY